MGLQHYTQDMSKIPLKYQKKMLFYTKYTHPTLICRGTHGRTDGRTDGRTHGCTHGKYLLNKYSGISSCSMGSTNQTAFHIFTCKSKKLLIDNISDMSTIFFRTLDGKTRKQFTVMWGSLTLTLTLTPSGLQTAPLAVAEALSQQKMVPTPPHSI